MILKELILRDIFKLVRWNYTNYEMKEYEFLASCGAPSSAAYTPEDEEAMARYEVHKLAFDAVGLYSAGCTEEGFELLRCCYSADNSFVTIGLLDHRI